MQTMPLTITLSPGNRKQTSLTPLALGYFKDQYNRAVANMQLTHIYFYQYLHGVS